MIYPPPDENWVAVSGDTLFLADLSEKTFAAGDVGVFGVPGGLAPPVGFDQTGNARNDAGMEPSVNLGAMGCAAACAGAWRP